MGSNKRSPVLWGSSAALVTALFMAYFRHLCPLFSESTPVLSIDAGQIQGRVGYSLRSGKPFWQFLSIPYAEPPLGKRRFDVPVPVGKWEGVRQVVKYPPHCLQYDAIVMGTVQGTEDCLFLNVFVSSPPSPNAPLLPTRPVLVFIHGGGFLSSGSRTYHPDFFMDSDELVLIIFNYRLGPFGFLNLAGDPVHSNVSSSNPHQTPLPRGNMGLKDQTLLLQWVQRNVGVFGGDPGKVTLIGESAGAASVSLHLLSPRSRGLFHKAIAISGSAFNPWSLSLKARKISQNLVRNVGCLQDDPERLMACLHNAPGEEIVKFQRVLQEPTVEDDLLVPSIEAVQTWDTFLGEHPLQILRKGKGSKIPLILGVNSGEGGLITARFDAMPHLTRRLDKIWHSKISTFTAYPDVPPSVVDKVRNYYFGSANDSFSSLPPEDFLEGLSKLSSDSLFLLPAHRAAVEHVRQGAPTYLYYYDYKTLMLPSTYSGFRAVTPSTWINPYLKVVSTMIWDWIVEHTLGRERGPRRFGICHAEDLYQLFNLEGMTGYFTVLDAEVSSALVETFVMFARGENSSPLSFRQVPWEPVSAKEGITLELDKPLPCMLIDNSEPKMVPEPYGDQLYFWASLGLGVEKTCCESDNIIAIANTSTNPHHQYFYGHI